MNKINPGDVFQISVLGGKETCVITSVYQADYNKRVSILYSTGYVDDVSCSRFLEDWHKIGRIDKFAEALKELEEMAKNS